MQFVLPIRRLVLSVGLLTGLFNTLQAESFLIDFGIAAGNAAQGSPTANPDSNGNYWNNVNSTAVGAGITGGTGFLLPNLISSNNTPSSVSIALSSGWKSSGIANGGLNQSTPALGIYGIQTATQDYYFVEGATGNPTTTQTISINNLDPGKSYDLTMFGSRNATGAPFVRGTRYSVADANGVHETVLQNSGPDLGGAGYNGNNSTLATLTGLFPTAGGTIVLSVANVHDEGIYPANPFGYLGLLAIAESAPITPVAQPTVRIDFGIAAGNTANGAPTANPDANGSYWNNVTSTAVASPIAGGTGLTLANLVTTANTATPLGLTLATGWKSSGIANGGLVSPTAARLGALAVSTATQDYYFIDGATGTAATLQITGLNPEKLYNFKLFGTRNTTDIRRSTYTVTAGNGVFTDNLQTSGPGIGNGTGGADGTEIYNGNNRNAVTFTGIQTDSNAAVTVRVAVAEGGFAYLGILEITEGASVPPLPPVIPPVVTLTDTFDRWVAQDALDPIPAGPVLFVGSSSIRRWESLTRDFADYRVVQRGFGGSQFSDLNGVINKIVAPYQPSAIVVWEGTNDIRVSHKSGATVLADFQSFVSNVRAQVPGVPICYLGITPCPSFFFTAGDDQKRRDANALIASYCASDPQLKLHYFDTASHLDSLHDAGTPEGTAEWNSHFVDDTHLNRKGYQLWLSIVRPALAAVLAPNKTFAANPNTLTAGEKLLFDFGPSESTVGDPTTNTDANGHRWNNWHPTNGASLINSGEHLANLVRTSGTGTGIRMTITGGFLGTGKVPAGGLFAPSPTLLGDLAVETATQDFWYSSADDLYNAGNDDLPGGFMLEGLNPALTYEFRFLGSRNTTETRVTEFAVYGANQKRVNQQTSGVGIGSTGNNANDDEITVVSGIRPDAFGQVFVDLTLVQGSNTHLNAMEIVASAPVQSWRTRHFTPSELANPAVEMSIWGAQADPDFDGRSNLLEYATGSDPRAGDSSHESVAMHTNGAETLLTLTFRKNLAATDVVYQVEATTNLAIWGNISDSHVSTTAEMETRSASVPTAGFSKRWLRLRVRLNSPP
ncbi:MAG: GDSL-type esterase/lipase family protein [Verrucomicrobiota bacterium]